MTFSTANQIILRGLIFLFAISTSFAQDLAGEFLINEKAAVEPQEVMLERLVQRLAEAETRLNALEWEKAERSSSASDAEPASKAVDDAKQDSFNAAPDEKNIEDKAWYEKLQFCLVKFVTGTVTCTLTKHASIAFA